MKQSVRKNEQEFTHPQKEGGCKMQTGGCKMLYNTRIATVLAREKHCVVRAQQSGCEREGSVAPATNVLSERGCVVGSEMNSTLRTMSSVCATG
eukprot:6202964-Pleurochrysis_carterae.AAC.1